MENGLVGLWPTMGKGSGYQGVRVMPFLGVYPLPLSN